MKFEFKNLIRCAAAIVCCAGMFACTDMDELEERVDSLDSRVTALETQVSNLNGNIDAIDKLLDGKLFITEIEAVEGEEGAYNLTMSDGSVYKIAQGKIGNTPQISIDDEGYWIVSYDNGESFERIEVDGQDNTAVPSAPKFRVDADGYWEISIDGGKTYEKVYYADGTTQVPATGEGNSFFQGVEFDEESNTLTLILADGKEVSFTVTADFVCQIVTDENPVQFRPGNARTFDVRMRGVGEVYIVTPDGWKASLEGEDASDPAREITATLTVTPPDMSTETKISADTEKDIVIHAASAADNRAIFAKMQVELTVVAMPEVEITVGETTSSSISYTVRPNTDVTSWKYIHQPASETAPDAESEGWMTGTETDLEFTDLESNTAYVLYVLPSGKDGDGKIEKAEASTLEKVIDDYYQAFMDGEDIIIGGTVYNKSQFAEEDIIHCTETVKLSSANNGQILFISPDCIIEELGNMTDAVIIGDDPDSRPTITITNSRYLVPVQGTESRLVLKNLNIVPGSEFSNYMFTVNKNFATDGAFGEFTLDNCDITMTTNAFYSISNARYLDRFIMENCKVNVPSGSGNRFIIHTAANENVFSEITLRNNVFYCESGLALAFRLLSGQTNNTNKTTVSKMTVENNTFVNTAPTNSSMIIALEFGDMTVSRNLMFFDKAITAGGENLTYIFGTADNAAGYPDTANCTDNIVYDSSKGYLMFYSSGYVPAAGQAENPTVITDNPFSGGTFSLATGTFVPNGTYSAYGSSIAR